ncbi:sodium:solute symporter [Francisella sp. SYW-9]|uniref:sodium:solute symporter n=1 Tax=Francisella sp. SYW-9 TaxID=2610888 RepID=UPI00123D69EC|nr:sodium:solute symporter [Francisella sp. SYW-9]
MKVELGFINYIILILYLLGMLLIGVYFSKRSSKSTDNFFKAGGRVPGWAVGISIFATTLSAITFMSIPALAYRQNWAMGFNNLSIVAISPLVVIFAVPFFRKLKVTSAYEYLECRFNIKMRLLGSVVFMMFHIFRVAIVIYLPTLALESVINIDPVFLAIAIGVLCIIYTFLGGIEGVIWADVIQGILLLGGALLIIIFLLFKINHPEHAIYNAVANQGKVLTHADFGLSLFHATIIGIFVGGVFNSLYQYIGSQDVVQRYNTTKDIHQTNKAVYLNAKLAFCVIFIFFGMGTLLYIFYQQNSAILPKGLNIDSIVPYFIVTQLPTGIAGFIVASIFAAAQSTISSSLNSISACFVTDIKDRFFRNVSEEGSVLVARLVIIIAGIIGTLIALYMTITNQAHLQMLFQSILGLFGGPIAGAFIIGILSKRVTGNAAFIGVLASVVVLYLVKQTSIYVMYYGLIGVVSSVVISYLLSFVLRDTKPISGLTYKTVNEPVAFEK